MSKVNIFLDKYEFYPGDIIIGKAVCDFKSSKDVKKVSIKLKGEESTHWTDREKFYDHLSRQYKLKPIDHNGNREFLSKSHIVHGEGTIIAGKHIFPFQFFLPENVPGSFQHRYGKIRFSVKLTIDRPCLSDYDCDKEITVISPIELQTISYRLLHPVKYADEKTIWCLCCASGPIQMEVNLEKRAFFVGEHASIKVNCLNMSNVNVKSIHAEIKLKLTFKTTRPTAPHYKHDTELVATSRNSGVGAHGDKTFNLNLEIPPSTVVPNFKGCELFSSNAELKVSAAISGFHTDLNITTDVALGHTSVLRALPMTANSIQSVPPYCLNEIQTMHNMPIRPEFNPESSDAVGLPSYSISEYYPCPSVLQDVRTPSPSASESPPPTYEEASKDFMI